MTRLLPRSEDDPCFAFCGLCGETVIPAASPRCPKCDLPFEGEGPDHLCSACLASPPLFERARAAVVYGGAAAEALMRFKYGRNPALARPLGRMLLPVAQQMGSSDVIVPVPLHPRRLRARGFNQSALLARAVAADLHVGLRTGVLERIRDTRAQAGISRVERLANLKGAFEVPRRAGVEGRRVLLIDDVITTSATVREAATTLIRSGAKSVEVLCFARAPDGLVLAPGG